MRCKYASARATKCSRGRVIEHWRAPSTGAAEHQGAQSAVHRQSGRAQELVKHSSGQPLEWQQPNAVTIEERPIADVCPPQKIFEGKHRRGPSARELGVPERPCAGQRGRAQEWLRRQSGRSARAAEQPRECWGQLSARAADLRGASSAEAAERQWQMSTRAANRRRPPENNAERRAQERPS